MNVSRDKTIEVQGTLVKKLLKENEELRNTVDELRNELQDAQAIIMANKLLVNCKIAKVHFVPRRHS